MVENSEKQLVNTIFQYRIGLTFKHKTAWFLIHMASLLQLHITINRQNQIISHRASNREVKVLTLQSVYKVQQN